MVQIQNDENGDTKELKWQNFEYMDVSLPVDENVSLYIVYREEDGETDTVGYDFN